MPRTATKKPPLPRRWRPWLVAAFAVMGVGALTWAGWHWRSTVVLERTLVLGAAQADSADVVALAAVDDSLLYAVDPALIADRVRRHPWVREATVRRRPTGTLAIRVTEREPVAVVLNATGVPTRFLDPLGYQMPYRPLALSLPLLRGIDEGYHPLRPIRNPTVRRLLRTLTRLDPAAHAIVSEFHLRNDGVRLITVPAHGQALTVRLGAAEFDGKLRRLRAFWDQAVLTRPDVTYDVVDLRFDSQIVTREAR